MSTHLPIRSLRPIYRHHAFHYTASRSFSSTIVRSKQPRTMDPAMIRVQAQHQGQKAPQTVQSQAYEQTDAIADDLGLFAGTFVRGNPPRLLPSTVSSARAWLEATKTRASYEWKWVKQRFQDRLGRLVYFWRLTNWEFKKRPRFKAKEVRSAAQEHYERMYKAFATNDRKELQEVCLSSIITSLQKRISSRPKDAKLTWEIVKMDRHPAILSNRATKLPIPGDDDNRSTPTAIRQVVLRMKTRQRLTIERPNTNAHDTVVVDPTGKKSRRLNWAPEGVDLKQRRRIQERKEKTLVDVHEKDVVEYVVLQQRMLRGKTEAWKLWGFTQPTTLGKLAKDKKYEDDTEAYQVAHPGLS